MLAKAVASIPGRIDAIDTLVITHAHRIFRAQRNVNHSRTLQNFLMTSHLGKIFVTELDNKLEERITENCSVRILSSSVWNEVSEEEKLLPGSFMLQDVSSGGPSPSCQCVSGQAAGKSDWVHPH